MPDPREELDHVVVVTGSYDGIVVGVSIRAFRTGEVAEGVLEGTSPRRGEMRILL